MKRKLVVLFVVGVFVMGWTSVAAAQQRESQLRLVEDIHVNPGMVAEFEARSKARAARMAKGNVTFAIRAAVTEGSVYRFTTLLENDFASLDKRSEQLDARPPADPPRRPSGAIGHIDRSIIRARPDLSYFPDNPRLQPSEFGFLHELRLYLRGGARAEVAGLLQKISELNKMHNTRDQRFVSSQVIGPGGRVVFIRFPARDAADYYTQRARNAGSLGDEFQALVSQINGLCRRIESVNYTIRRDLGYRPSN